MVTVRYAEGSLSRWFVVPKGRFSEGSFFPMVRYSEGSLFRRFHSPNMNKVR